MTGIGAPTHAHGPRQSPTRLPSSTPSAGAGAARRRGSAVHPGSRLAFGIPGAVLLGAFAIWPLIDLVNISLHRLTPATINADWGPIVVSNFISLVSKPEFSSVVVGTIAFVMVVTVLGMVGGFAVAVAVRSSTRGGNFLLGMMVFVWALPPVINGSIWKFLLSDHGLINQILRSTGLSATGVGFLYDTHLALWSVALVNAWAVVPFNALIFRASLLGIDAQLLEAADVDGVNAVQRIRYLLLPHVRPAAIILTILTIVYAFRSFDFIYVMTAGGPGTSSTTLPFLAYLQAFQGNDYGAGAATAVLSLVIVLVLALFYARDVGRNEEA